jgi:DNA primase
MESYHRPERVDTPKSRRYRGTSYAKPIDTAKEAVPVIDLADRLCGPGGLRRRSSEWAGCCPLPDHEDKTPSFVVYTETNSWFCFGCLRGGDVVELARLAWGYSDREARVAAAEVLMEFGHELPERPPAWFRKQERQKQTRDAVGQTRKNIYQRRVFKYLALPMIDAIKDEEERERELKRAWSEFRRLMP